MRRMRTLPLALLALASACGTPAPASQPTPPSPAPAAPVAETPGAPTPPAASGPPVARVDNVVEERFGVSVSDPYRWMEGAENAERDAWMRAHGAHAAAYLDAIPGRSLLLDRIRELGMATSASGGLQLAGGRTFFYQTGAGEQLAKLMVRGADGKDRVLLDPATLGSKGSHASLNNFTPSPDGTRIAYNVSEGGSEISSIKVLEVDTGKHLNDVVPGIWGEFAASWLPDGSGFFYTRMAEAPGEGVDPMLNMVAKLHLLGDAIDKDVVVLGRDLAPAMTLGPEEFPIVAVAAGSPYVIALGVGARSEMRISIARLADVDRTGNGKTPWKTVAEYADSVENVVVHGERVYLQTFAGASNRKIVSVPAAKPVLAKARLEIAEDPQSPLVAINGAKDALYVRQMVAGRARLLRLPWPGRNQKKAVKPAPIALPFDGWIDDLATDVAVTGAVFGMTGWTQPGAYYGYDPKTKEVEPIGLAVTTNADYTGIVAEEVEATSADGTKVPLSILRRGDLALDGSHPAIVNGYGGYGYSMTPSFSPTRLAWLERGGVFAVCHVRGGGEKGHDWQVDGTHEHKMNGIRDFIACGEYLVEKGYTAKSRLAATGGSMGGILVGRAVTERPDLFAAANIAVGMVNPLRMLEAENGANQKAELGDPETEAGFTSILAMDPYQHVESGTAYPAVIFTVGLNDRRVAPWMTAKMAARLQAATASDAPILVRIDEEAGHGVGSTRDQAFAERADVWAFFLTVAKDPEFAR
jgi:prolyl oligopeptidase